MTDSAATTACDAPPAVAADPPAGQDGMLAAALGALRAGFSILPIDHRTKKPLNRLLPRDAEGKPVWEPYQYKAPDEHTVRGWFPEAKAFAIVGGAVSGGALVFDFDVPRLYHAWVAEVGDLAAGLPVQRTGGGRYQVICRCDQPGCNAQLAFVECESEESGRKAGIETRGEGGYAVVAPGLHPTGNRYSWISGDLTQVPVIPQALADYLLATARRLDECPHTRKEKERIERDARLAHQRRAAAERNGTASVIDQFNQAHRIEELLERHGYTPSGDRFVRPGGKSPSVSVKDGRSCHFSTNDPLNDGKVKGGIGVHDAFDVFAHLEYGGDVKGAVKAAARELGIRPSPPSGGMAPEGGVWTPDPEYIIEFPEPMRVAEHFLARRRTADGMLTLRRYREQWWSFDHGGYRPLSDEVALVDLYRHLDLLWTPVREKETGEPTGDYRKLVARSSTVSEAAKAIRACGAMVDGEMPQWLDGRAAPAPCDVVAFRNGLLDAAAWCRGERVLLPLTPAWFGSVACPYDFDPAAACPGWLGYLDQAFDKDAQSIDLLQEWFGLNLVPDNQYEKFLMAVGPPRGGKGTALEVLGAVLGEGQAATTSFSKLSSRFGLAPLVGKLAAILPDAHVGHGTDAKAALEVLKTITGGDPQAVDRKGIDELPRVRLLCRFSIAVNELPKLPDDAGALKTRLLLLHFRNSFAGREDTTLKPRLRAEAPAVAVWALEGLKRLRQQGRFTVPQRSAAMAEAFETIVSPVLGFLQDCCEVTGDQGIWDEKDKLYKAWCDWSRDRGSDPGSKADFGQSLCNANRGIAPAKRGPRGQQFNVYAGVRLCD